MKKVVILLAVFSVLASWGIGNCATAKTSIESLAGVEVYGPSKTDLPIDGDWGPVDEAVEVGIVDPLWPTIEGAKWITTKVEDPKETTYRLFKDSFTPPCTASVLSGTLQTAANSTEDVYLNGQLLGSGGNVLNTFTFTPIAGENVFDFVVETTGVQSGTNPAGLIYKAELNYGVADVLWRPPLIKSKRTIVKNGTTLPIKFRLASNGKVITDVSQVYLAVTGGGTTVARFDVGTGQNALRFGTEGGGQYIALFKTKNYNLQPGIQYTISVNDLCSGQELGSVKLQAIGKNPKPKKK